MTMTSDRDAVIGNVAVAFEDRIGLKVRMLWALDVVAPTGDASAAVTHVFGCGDDFAAMIGSVTESN